MRKKTNIYTGYKIKISFSIGFDEFPKLMFGHYLPVSVGLILKTP
jgi:hypothetical protein